MQTLTTEWLQSTDTLREVPATQLQRWIENSEYRTVEEEAFLFKEGDPVTGTFVIVKGKVRIFLKQQNRERNIEYFQAKDVTGYLPFSRGVVASACGEVIERLEVMFFPIEKMKELISNR